MRLFLIRHGESMGNVQQRWQGQTEYPLSATGVAQSERLAKRLATEHIAAVYSSTQSRAAQTAAILATHLNVTLYLRDELREYDVGVVAGLTWEEMRQAHPEIYAHYDSEHDFHPVIPGEEGAACLHQRLRRVLKEIEDVHGAGNAAIVTHAGVLMALFIQIFDLDIKRRAPFTFTNASLSLVEYVGSKRKVIFANDNCHLDGPNPHR